MNLKKIAFILCINDKEEFEEAAYYINRLVIPEGYEKDIITVEDASSMASGYNAAMTNSDAKYKVYLHQDVFIINKNFVLNMLDVFQNNPQIGMLGCIGCDNLPLNAWAITAWNVGKIYHNCIPNKVEKRQNEDRTPIQVDALDGLLLVTQYDLTWREDLFDGWDFYDISQCMEMKRAGYQVTVPYQQEPWCFHDCAYSKMEKYQEYCMRFVHEYQDIKPFQKTESSQQMAEYNSIKEAARNELERIIQYGKKAELKKIFADSNNRGYLHLREFEILSDIASAEELAGIEQFWKQEDTYESLLHKMRMIKFALKRIEYDADEEDTNLTYILEHYSIQAINVLFQTYIVEQQKVYTKIKNLKSLQ